jgi:hypothetical protein
MMNIRDEQATNTTIPGELIPPMTITSPPDYQVQDEVGFPPWEEYQESYDRSRNTVRAAIFGGLSGGIFFFGLLAAILSDHFWPVFLVARDPDRARHRGHSGHRERAASPLADCQAEHDC